MLPLVSVIIPTYNRAKLLPRALNSIVKQTYPNWEVIVVDDGSADETSSIMESYIQGDHRIFYTRLAQNSGVCVARNEGIKNAKGEYVTFLDSDDEYVPEKIEKQVQVFLTSSITNVGVVSCGNMDERDGTIYYKWVPNKRGNIVNSLLSKERVGARTPLLMVKRSLIVNNNIFFDPDLPSSEEWDFLLQVCLRANFDFVPEPLVIAHHHSNERVYTPTRALVAIEKQYHKNRDLLLRNKEIHDKFVLKMVEQNYLYGFPDKASTILQDKTINKNFKVVVWQSLIKTFPKFGTIPSKVAYKLVKKFAK